MNAYLIFAKEVKAAVMKSNPSATQDDIDKIVHQRWRHVLTSEEKRPYFDKAEKLRQDAARKQARKRERARLASAASASASSGSASPPSTPASPTASTGSGRSAQSAPSSPDSGCPSPEGSDAVTPPPNPPASRRGSKNATFNAANRKVPVVLFPARESFAPDVSSRRASNHLPEVMGAIPLGPGGHQLPYHPMVPQMIHPALALSYLNPYFLPPTALMHPQMQSFFAGAAQANYYGNLGSQMAAPHAYYGMPMYHQAQMQQQQILLQQQQQQHFCSGAAAPTQKPPGDAGADLEGRDFANLCPQSTDQAINQSNLKSVQRDVDTVQRNATSDACLNDVSSSSDSANEE